jgi:hypothetical protein
MMLEGPSQNYFDAKKEHVSSNSPGIEPTTSEVTGTDVTTAPLLTAGLVRD